MIKQLEIENFRCFGKSTLSGFERVNLIGGQNNSGKTAFLEALYLNCSPRAETVMEMRGITKEIILKHRVIMWNSLFLNHSGELKIKIASITDSDEMNTLWLSQVASQARLTQLDIKLQKNFKDSEFPLLNFSCQFAKDSEVRLTYNELHFAENNNEIKSEIFGSEFANLLKEEKKLKLKDILKDMLKDISFISATTKASTEYLAKQYDKCFLQGHVDKMKEAFHIIDPSITEIRTLMSGEPTLYLGRKNQRPMSITLFGDAMNRVAHFALELINNQAGILLIDEIENGIHHSHQKQLWQWLFALAVELDVQIFATTHSLEMLTAFKEAAMGTQYESEAAYFEFARHVKTGEIIGIKHQIDELDYALSHDGEIRGE